MILLAFFFLNESAHAVIPARPFVLINSSELSTLRQHLAHGGWKAQLYRAPRKFHFMYTGTGIRTNADFWLNREVVIPERSGHYHSFFCTDGTRLTIPAGQKFVFGPYACPACGKQYSGSQYEGALRRIVHAQIGQAALDLALVGAIETSVGHATKAVEILKACAKAYPGPHTSVLVGGMQYQSLDEAVWVIPLAQAYDLLISQ